MDARLFQERHAPWGKLRASLIELVVNYSCGRSGEDVTSDIFISYARPSAPQATAMAASLRDAGYSVWIDEDLSPHRPFASEIESELTAAKAALVIWSEHSTKSEWVLSEANRAREDRKLVQVVVDGARLPMPFDQIHCAGLSSWTGAADHPAWRKVLASIATLVGRPAAGDKATDLPERAVAPDSGPPHGQTTENDNLPARLTKLIGRQADVDRLVEMLSTADLVTITGTGGVGKTRLALAVAKSLLGSFPEGVWLVELAPIADASHVPTAVARAMGIALPVGQDLVHALVDRLSHRECLIILDNCEHLVDAVAVLADALLEASSGIKLLASSQEILGIESERVFRLRSLAADDAAALFAERAEAADSSFAIRPRDEAAVAAICARLDGVPLAIEMAAARAPSLGCAEVLQRLDDRFHLLTSGRRTALPRQRTLAATVDWSHGLLSARDAAAFRRLGVFSGGFTLEAAQVVAANGSLAAFDVVDAVSSLVAKSLLAADAAADGTRYRLLETTRAYALDKLYANGETLATQRRHAQWAAQFYESAWRDFASHVDDDTFAKRYFGENDNLERALDWAFGPSGDLELGVKLVALSHTAFSCQSLYNDFLRWLGLAFARLGAVTSSKVSDRFLVVRLTALMMNAPGQAVEIADDAISAARRLDDPTLLLAALNAKGWALLLNGRAAEAAPVADEALALVSKLPTSRVTTQTKSLVGSLRYLSDGKRTQILHQQGIAELRAFGADGLANWYECGSLMAGNYASDVDEEVSIWRNRLTLIKPRQMLSGLTLALATSRMITALAARGRPDDLQEACRIYRQKYKLLPTTMNRVWLCMPMALAAAKLGRGHDAAVLAGFAETFAKSAGDHMTLQAANALCDRLRLDLPSTDVDAAFVEGSALNVDEAVRLALSLG
ncbi:MAG TPA: TIR domain-containing protein [Caulobacteraceae bacterium]